MYIFHVMKLLGECQYFEHYDKCTYTLYIISLYIVHV